MIRLCAALLVALVAHTASAEDTYYEILQDEYNDARDAITMTDFDRVGHPNAKRCVEIHPDNPDQERLVQIGRFTKYNEGQGPLLPGKTVTKVIWRRYSSNVFHGNNFDNVTMDERTREVRSEYKVNNERVWRVIARKTYNTIVYRRDAKSGDKNVMYFGYCYEPGTPEKERP